jgi:hypothetical protein
VNSEELAGQQAFQDIVDVIMKMRILTLWLSLYSPKVHLTRSDGNMWLEILTKNSERSFCVVV